MFKQFIEKIKEQAKPKEKDWRDKQLKWTTPSGVPYVERYKEMLEAPHLLIAGSTGSGKSTVLNGILMTALALYLPTEAQFIMIDPKRVELSPYKELPHTLNFAPTAESADILLKRVITYMDGVYEEMEEQRIRQAECTHLYIVIDELATILISKCAKSIKESLQDILQRGRAANIHVIACTQSPSRRTLPAELVINFTNRVALHCVSAIESRQILNEKGAEDIPARSGRAIYMNYFGDCTEIKGIPCYSDDEIAEMIDFWVEQKFGEDHLPSQSIYGGRILPTQGYL